MATETRWVFLYEGRAGNEIGTGLRKVEAIIGHKWVRLRSATWDHEKYPKNRVRIRRAEWDIIVEKTEARQRVNFAAHQQITARAAYYEKHGKLPSRKLRVVLDV